MRDIYLGAVTLTVCVALLKVSGVLDWKFGVPKLPKLPKVDYRTPLTLVFLSIWWMGRGGMEAVYHNDDGRGAWWAIMSFRPYLDPLLGALLAAGLIAMWADL